jgi:cyclohexadieny/prephenate dehydrogenase
MAPPLFERITIIGLGLIGSSIARAAHERGVAETVVGCDQNEITLSYGRKQGFIDVAAYDPAVAVKGSQLVVIATPPSTLESVGRQIAGSLEKGALVIDTCSVKRIAAEALGRQLPDHIDFIPTHPIAGSEHTGISAGRADLFEGKRIIITPEQPLQGESMQKVNSLWEKMGARVEGMPPHIHDMVYAYVSHLPQLLAFACAAPMGHLSAPPKAGSTLAKFLRLGGSSPLLWSDIFNYNKDNVLRGLDEYLDVLTHIYGELGRAPDGEGTKENDILVRTVLFPRIAASCLVTTVMNAERKAGFPFARYTGTGFADFTVPATVDPDAEMEKISEHGLALRAILQAYIDEIIRRRAELV